MTKIAAMIHRIVATPSPRSLAAIRNRSMLLSLPTEPIGPYPLNPAQASEALDLVQAGDRTGGSEMGSEESIEVQAEERGYHISRGGTCNRGAEPAWGWN